MELHKIAVADIEISSGRREANPETVEALTRSMEKIGLQTPISVWTPDDGETVRLVAGRHRLEAARALGWERIDCVVVNLSEIDRRLWEIAENLHRAELTVTERAEHVAEWIKLVGERESVKAQVAPLGKPHDRGRPNQGINAATRELGIDRTEAQRSVKIAALAPEAKAEAKILHLENNQSALLKAARGPTKEDQLRALREEAARKADRRDEVSASERRIESAVNAVRKLSPEELTVFADWFDAFREDGGATVFDHTAVGQRVVK